MSAAPLLRGDFVSWEVGGVLPVFHGTSLNDFVEAWQAVHVDAQQQQWKFAAIAASITRLVGGRPRRGHARTSTFVQRFCQAVGITRQHFHYLARTYRAFAKTGNTDVTSFMASHNLHFDHFAVAARLAPDDPVAAVRAAHEKHWSANELERQLSRKGNPAWSLSTAMAKLRAAMVEQLSTWPASARSDPEVRHRVLEVPQQLFDDLDARTMPPLIPAEVHALRWIRADLENIPFTKHTFVGAGARRGGNLEVIPGSAGAPIYRSIVGAEGRELVSASRGDVARAIDNLLAGKMTKTGELALGVARELADGAPYEMVLPPDAGGDLTGTRWETDDHDDDDLPDCLSSLVPDCSDPIGLHDMETNVVTAGIGGQRRDD